MAAILRAGKRRLAIAACVSNLSDLRLGRAPSFGIKSPLPLLNGHSVPPSVTNLSDPRHAKGAWFSNLSDLRPTRAPSVGIKSSVLASVTSLPDSRLAKAPSVTNLSVSRLAIALTLAKAALVSCFLVSALTIAAIWMAIEKGFDIQSGLEKFHLPRPGRPYFNNPIEEHESDNNASVGDKKNRTAELAASRGGSLALAFLINKSLFPLRLPFAAALICPITKLLASCSNINNSKVLVRVTLLSITIHVEPLLLAFLAFWMLGSSEYAKKPKEESAIDGGAISFVHQVLTKVFGGMESGPVGRKGCIVAGSSGMPFDPLGESTDAFKENESRDAF